MDNNCPHCDHNSATLTSYSYNNGSAQQSNYRCEHCNCEWRLDRQHRVTVLVKGATPDEIRSELHRFHSLWITHQVMCEHNAPDHWHLYVR